MAFPRIGKLIVERLRLVPSYQGIGLPWQPWPGLTFLPGGPIALNQMRLFAGRMNVGNRRRAEGGFFLAKEEALGWLTN